MSHHQGVTAFTISREEVLPNWTTDVAPPSFLVPDDQASACFWPGDGGAVRFQAVFELTFQPEDLVAALYGYADRPPEQLTAQAAGELIAAELALFGLAVLQQRSARIAAQERSGSLSHPDWLHRCRQCVNGILSGQVT